MEFQFPSIPLLLAFLFFILMVLKTLKAAKAHNSSAPKLPPGPRKFPLIGNMHQLVTSLPHHTLRDLAGKYGPLMHLQLGQVSTIVVSSPEIAKEVLKDHDIIFCQRPYLLASRILSYDSTNIGFAPYGDYWRLMRKIFIMELLNVKRVQSFRAIREEEVLNLVESIYSKKKTPINLSRKIFSSTHGATARAAFGGKRKDQEVIISVIEEALVLLGGFTIVDMYPSVKLLQVISSLKRKVQKIQKKIDHILQNIVNEHRERPRTIEGSKGDAKDLVDVLLRLQKDGALEFPLTDDNIKAVILDIFSAGSDTSSTVVEWAMSEMMKTPRVMKKAQAEVRSAFDKTGSVDETRLPELKYLSSVIKETMRLHPPAPLLGPRESSEQCSINGHEIPAKTKVIVNAWAIGRDPRYWNQAEEFQPERFTGSGIDFRGRDFEYIPFGAGRRICPGISFALPNIELPLANLLFHFDWELPNGMKIEELEMTERFGLTVRRKNDLHLIPIPYDPPSS